MGYEMPSSGLQLNSELWREAYTSYIIEDSSYGAFLRQARDYLSHTEDPDLMIISLARNALIEFLEDKADG